VRVLISSRTAKPRRSVIANGCIALCGALTPSVELAANTLGLEPGKFLFVAVDLDCKDRNQTNRAERNMITTTELPRRQNMRRESIDLDVELSLEMDVAS
jgi:hypothetical protein